jgi:GNAT superfamily N-acetyltransferase
MSAAYAIKNRKMTNIPIIYKMNCSRRESLIGHLERCDGLFDPPLSSRIDIRLYAGKIRTRGVTFEAWHDTVLGGLVAGYFNDPEKRKAFITVVSVESHLQGLGIARTLLKQAITHAEQLGFSQIHLEVDTTNDKAIGLYEKLGFKKYQYTEDSILMCRTTDSGDSGTIN